MIGTTVSHYRIVEHIGSGGMGVVYLAEDIHLHRKVALKFLSETAAQGPEAQERLLREAQAEGTVDHPNIATVYEIGTWQGQTFIAMAYYAGETLKQRLERGPLSIDDAANIGTQIAAGLEAAHAAGIVHRDLKPANVIITTSGQVKILDFGLAKELSKAEAETKLRITTSGTTIGTMAYMAPEQALGQHVDQRADVWAFGAVMFEMLTGRLPFEGPTAAALLLTIVSGETPVVEKLRPETPVALQQVVARALVRRQDDRTLTAGEIASTLATLHQPRSSVALGSVPARPRRWRTIAALGLVAAAIGVGGLWLKRRADVERLRAAAIPEIRQLAAKGQFFEAYRRARQMGLPGRDDAVLAALWSDVTRGLTVTSEPAGAEVSIAAYGEQDEKWISLGQTPLTEFAVPQGLSRVRILKNGYVPYEDAFNVFPIQTSAINTVKVTLIEDGSAPAGMVRVASSDRAVPMYLVPGSDPVDIVFRDFWIDRYEVTNRRFKAFVDAGGYQRREFWRHEFVRDGKEVTWEDAMAMFRDATGRQGPATWQVGAYPDGQDDYPVTGVSWYEAAAYAQFAGKSLPTLPHFLAVAGVQFASRLMPLANLAGKAVSPVGTTRALSRFGTYDLAGNVKEWIVNPAGGDLRYIVGGAWDEPAYMFTEPDARRTFERAANFGFRCVRYDAGDPSPAALGGFIERPNRDYGVEKPAADPVFDAYRRFFAYDRTPVKAAITNAFDGNPDWRVESLSFPAAYGGENILARLYLPRNAKPPYQTVLFQAGAAQWNLRASPPVTASPPIFASVIRSGRAVIYPVVKGAFERGSDQFTSTTPKDSTLWRDYTVAFYKDLARTLDYLATRPDIDKNAVAFLGQSRGASLSPIVLALEPQRVKAAVLLIPGFYLSRQPPEVDIVNFMPRVTQPVLMLSGRYDFIFPEQRSQLPFFGLLGTPSDLKRRVSYDTGHNVPQAEMMKETLDWLDRYLGPVQR
jgi:serine/threonine protein kinase/predicted esterase